MNNLLLNMVARVAEVQRAASYQSKKQACILTGLAGSSKSVFFAAIDQLLEEKGSIAFVTATREEIRAYRRELNYFYPNLPMQELYPVSLPRVQVETQSLELQAGRSAALRFLQGEERGIVFITAEALQQRQLRPSGLSDKQLVLKIGEEREQKDVVACLLELGYERTDQVDAIGQFCLRGDILDIFPINCNSPVRVEWFDNELDAMRSFDVNNQRSIETLEQIKVMPLTVDESVSFEASVFDYCAKSTLLVVDEPVRVFEMLEKLEKENKAYASELFTKEELISQCATNGAQLVSALGHSYLKELPALNIPVRSVSPYNKNTNLLVEDLHNWLAEGITPIIMLSGSVKARGFAENLHNYGLKGEYVSSEQEKLIAGKVNVLAGELDHGFRFWDTQWLLLTENDIYGMQKRKRLHTKNQGQQLQYFSDIKVGDYVVHKVHGIGRYIGVENVEVGGIHRDYLLLQYAGEDKLYVPVDQVSLLHKYVGSEGAVPRLSKMGGTDWKRTTAKAAKAITELAEELLRLYAQRQIVPGHAFSPDNQMQKEFEDAFPYEETPDQLKAIAEIKGDMERPQPMERLLCGDVGYGKTEVAIRAAFKAVLDGKQVAVMVPTTVLAQQHFLTFKERMRNFGVNVEMLNRFCSTKEQKRILQNLEDGRVDVLIGTHRLLQSDIQFPDLGLLIIDEEQRFGVAQKEKIKKWRTGIDVLTLSATPIPRTLHLALVNGRDMSVIESPPEDRLPVETYVSEYNDGMIKEAIERELRRGGRVYYVHNRVGGLEAIAARVRRLVPGINIKLAHGQMNEQMLEDAMISFYEGSCDMLLCTTIVENGLDVPLANTIIIDGAENFGLSQLYQMRGRVGRSSRLAYAYFVYKPNKALSEIAEKRLQAIRDFTELGAGFKIAMRDLEIRGAGNLLGSQQHGHIVGIGFAAYCQMLEDTINRLKNGKVTAIEPEPVLEIPAEAYIPDDYIADPRYKMEIYRRLAEMEYGQRDDMLDELIDRFGNPPEAVHMLWRLASLKGLCRLMKVRGINVRPGMLRITFGEQANVNPEVFMQLLNQHKSSMSFKNGKEPQLLYKTNALKDDPLKWLEKTLPMLALGSKFVKSK
ncbi:MAG: transcription-repair coupling factor [Phascolarctobacterium sp.]|nr:transcription-repair coupling factor [Phascolarctobacterium sp.]